MGGVIENYVAIALRSNGYPLYYWTSEGKAEIYFILNHPDGILPIEVKKSVRTKSRSLSVYTEINKPIRSIRISAKNFGNENDR